MTRFKVVCHVGMAKLCLGRGVSISLVMRYVRLALPFHMKYGL